MCADEPLPVGPVIRGSCKWCGAEGLLLALLADGTSGESWRALLETRALDLRRE